MEKGKGKSTIIVALLITVMVMAVGYAALAANLNINGTASISSRWDVEITGFQRKDNGVYGATTGGGVDETNTPVYTATTILFNVEFTTPGQFAEYEGTITNNGTLPAYLKSITGPTVSAGTIDEALGIKFSITGVSINDSLAPGQTHTVHVRVEWDSAATTVPAITSKTLTMTFDYAQDIS